MFILFQRRQHFPNRVGKANAWYVFKTDNTRYTIKLAKKIQRYLAENIDPSFSRAKDEQIRELLSVYATINVDAYRVDLESRGKSNTQRREYVQLINIDELYNEKQQRKGLFKWW